MYILHQYIMRKDALIELNSIALWVLENDALELVVLNNFLISQTLRSFHVYFRKQQRHIGKNKDCAQQQYGGTHATCNNC